MPQTKIQGKFYPLTGDVTTKLRKGKLTAAEWRIWSYLVEIDPWGDRYQDINSLDVMSKCDCSRATFYRAIAKLQKLKIFDIQDQGFSIRNLTGASWLKSSQAKEQETELNQVDLKNEKVVSKMRLNSQKRESCLKNETEFAKMRLDSQICENKLPETPPDKGLESSQTLQTYSDFKDSLSESERENFFNFVQEKTNNLERPINDLEAWLASKNAAKQNRWEIYYRSYQEERINEIHKTTRHSENGAGSALEAKNLAIAKFREKMRIDELVDEPVDVNSEEFQQQQAEFNKLLDNPPEPADGRGLGGFPHALKGTPSDKRPVQDGERKSLAQQRREQIAEAKRQQEEGQRANKEAAEERAKQQNFNIEEYQAEIQRQIEEFNRLHNIGNNPEIDKIDEENLEDE
jgi:hypothetical protein